MTDTVAKDAERLRLQILRAFRKGGVDPKAGSKSLLAEYARSKSEPEVLK